MLNIDYDDGAQGRALVDWLSLSLSLVWNANIPYTQQPAALVRSTCAALGWVWNEMKELTDLRSVQAQKGYSLAVQCPLAGMRMDARTNGATLVTWSGSGCEWLRARGLLSQTLTLGASKASRLDIALDRPTTYRPTDIINVKERGIKYVCSLWISPEGETVYIGSMSSDRFARLYVYDDPAHERKGVLRLEVVFRDKIAKLNCQRVLDGKIMSILHSEVERLEIPQMLEGARISTSELERLKSYVKMRNPNTVKWIDDAVIPALIRLENDGDLPDVIAYLEHKLALLRQTHRFGLEE